MPRLFAFLAEHHRQRSRTQNSRFLLATQPNKLWCGSYPALDGLSKGPGRALDGPWRGLNRKLMVRYRLGRIIAWRNPILNDLGNGHPLPSLLTLPTLPTPRTQPVPNTPHTPNMPDTQPTPAQSEPPALSLSMWHAFTGAVGNYTASQISVCVP